MTDRGEGRSPAGAHNSGSSGSTPGPATTADFLRELRSRLDLTQTELSRMLGVSNAGVSQWETGTRSPSALVRATVVAALDYAMESTESRDYLRRELLWAAERPTPAARAAATLATVFGA